jgi:hypothetical protein
LCIFPAARQECASRIFKIEIVRDGSYHLSSMQPQYRFQFDAPSLLRDHPPYFRNANKDLLFHLAYPDGQPTPAMIQVTRWPKTAPTGPVVLSPMPVELRPDFYDYQPAADPQAMLEWHVNFADPNLFYGYSSGLFAQDEMQVAEHPLLASVRQALLDRRLEVRANGHNGAAPVLVRNVERRLSIATHPDPAAGRPHGLYGNRFATAPADAVRKAARRIDPPTFSNIIAMAAPAGGFGAYMPQQIDGIFLTAHTAFAAAVHESTQGGANPLQTLIHTGFWGCGAFGGNRHMMIILQAMAARTAGVCRLVLHVGDNHGIESARHALEIVENLVQTNGPMPDHTPLIDAIARLGLRWGNNDGH